MSLASRFVATPTAASTNPRNTLRLLTLAAVMLVVVLQQPDDKQASEPPGLAQAEQAADSAQ